MNTGPNLPLTRYLDKIVALHVSADVLIRYACSPRLRTYFTNKKFDLATVPDIPYTGTLPTTREQWVECLQRAFFWVNHYSYSVYGLWRGTTPTSRLSIPRAGSCPLPRQITYKTELTGYCIRSLAIPRTLGPALPVPTSSSVPTSGYRNRCTAFWEPRHPHLLSSALPIVHSQCFRGPWSVVT